MTSTKSEVKDLVEELERYKGKHTEFISVYIPAGYEAVSVQKQLEGEKATAKNIKSTTTRNNVIDALEKIIRELKNIKRAPPNGLALFAGDISPLEGVQDIKYWSIEPPRALNTRLYRCDKEFVLDPLKEMLEVEEVFGLLVMDRKEATIGLLEGKLIQVFQKMTSGIPSQIRAGGQCLSSDTLIMRDNGEIIEIKDSHNPLLILSENFNIEKTEKTPLIAKWENNRELFKITTCYPKFEIKASKEHAFFVRTERGIEEKPLSEIKEGDYLIMPEKINLELKEQEIDFNPIIKDARNMKEVSIPKILTTELVKILGYYLGDGNHEIDRISFSEQRKEVAEYYCNLIEKCLSIKPSLKFREDKGYYQIRLGSRIIAQLFKKIFEEKDKTHEQTIPQIILKSPDGILASFISGFFDAEGYVSGSRVAFGINNEKLARYMQFSLLRLGIISSLSEYDNRRNPYSKNIRYTLSIDDIESLKKFRDFIGFSSVEKQQKVNLIIENRSNKNKVRQLVVNGKDVARIIRNSGLNTGQFRCPDFFINKKRLSKEMFKKNILDKINNEDLKKRLGLFYLSNLIAAKISKIQLVGLNKTIDIETKNHNFVANGLIVHNSAQRFHRITEGLTKEYYKRVAEEMKKIFYNMPKLKGIIVGGPVPTKDEFVEGDYLIKALKEKVIGRIDIGDTSESGLNELVEKSGELLAQQEITKEKDAVKDYFNALKETHGMATIGFPDTKKALEYGAAQKLYFSLKLDKDIQKELTELAANSGAEAIAISVETVEGQQFYNIGGVGSILRFKI